MQLLFDFFPVIAFFVTYKLTDIFVATGVLIAAVIVQTAIQWIRHRRVSAMALVSAALVLVFGGLTLWIHDEMFIKWKVSIVNWLFAAGFLVSHYAGDRPFIERMLGESVTLERAQWLKLSWMWIGFFFALGVVNLYIVYNFSTDVWVAFKLYGLLGLTLAFALAQGVWLSSRAQTKPPAHAPTNAPE
ncbi:MAG TPA: septation protein A [Steroidobacteraceae bacterium]|jgi:intracellular septation protein